MKKTATTFALLSCFVFGYGQNIVLLDEGNNIISNTIIDIDIDSSSSSTKEIFVKNVSSIPDTIKVSRTVYNLNGNDKTQFCWGGLCYLYTTNTSSLALTIAPGDTVNYAENGFHAIFNSGIDCVTRMVHYKFYNVNNYADSTGITLRYLCSTGIDDLLNHGGEISNAYPNPANSLFSIKYELKEFSKTGKILFYDMLGKQVKEVVLNDKHGTSKINVLELNAGIYFYSFVVDDKIISTKRMVISHED